MYEINVLISWVLKYWKIYCLFIFVVTWIVSTRYRLVIYTITKWKSYSEITVARVSGERFKKASASRPSLDFFFVERPNLEDTSSSSSMRWSEDQIVNRDSPVLHTGRPNRSNRSCSRGFFTSESTSQSLLKAGLKFTCDKFLIILSNYFSSHIYMHACTNFQEPWF